MSASTFVDTSILVWTQDSQDLRKQARAIERLKGESVTGLNLATAKAAGCTLLLTADVQSAKTIDGVRFENPVG